MNKTELRDHFAGLAMASWMTGVNQDSKHPVSGKFAKVLACASYLMADAMMSARLDSTEELLNKLEIGNEL
jgi:hypothetical protein